MFRLASYLLMALPVVCIVECGQENSACPPPTVPVVARPVPAPKLEPKAGKHALLVGTSRYPHLPKRFWLEGPVNDVILMRHLLKTKFDFSDEDIATLAEKGGKALPTRANIEREFRRLAEIVKADDQVVIFMAGHGSQQPEAKNTKDPEPDGLDEFYLPRDVKTWDGETGSVPNAILDNHLREWLDSIRAKKASVWLIIDACHSGTMLRAAGERTRKVDAQTGLKIPAQVLAKARKTEVEKKGAKDKTRGGSLVEARSTLAVGGGVVALYACRPSEVTVERMFPETGTSYHGLLTHTLSRILTRANQEQPLTYRELLQRLHTDYANMGRTFPTPVLEGEASERDREVLGRKVWLGRSRIILSEADGEWKVNAGSLHGLTAGSILAVFPPAGEKGKAQRLGHVSVARAKALSAFVEPCKYEGVDAPKKLPANGRCEVVELDYGDSVIHVAVDPMDDADMPISEADKARAEKDVKTLAAKKRSLIQFTSDIAQADWLVRVHEGMLHLVPAAEWSRRGAKSMGKLFGPFAGPKRAEPLEKSFQRIARAELVKKLASSSNASIARRPSSIFSRVRLKTEVVRLRDENDEKGMTLPYGDDGMRLYKHDLVTLRMTNLSRFDVDITVLYVDSGYGIHAWFPGEGEFNRLKTGEKLFLPPIVITTNTTGTEYVGVVGVKATTAQPIDFTFLQQPTIERVRGLGVKTPLGKLMQATLYREGKTRSFRRDAVEAFYMQMMLWRIMAAKR